MKIEENNIMKVEERFNLQKSKNYNCHELKKKILEYDQKLQLRNQIDRIIER